MATPGIRVVQIEIIDPDGVGPLQCSVITEVTNNDANTAAVGFARAGDSRVCLLGRAAFNALLGALRRPSGDTWRDDIVAHPIAKLP